MDTSLDSLDAKFKPLAMALLARLVEARIPVVIVNTRRTDVEQADALARHVSGVPRSKHQDGLAMDVAPFETFAIHGMNKILWDGSDPIWLRIGQIAEGLGLKWGGRWTVKDLGHIEYVGSSAGDVSV